MRITAVTRFRLAALHGALKRLGWTQAELARRSGLGQYTISQMVNLRRKPSPEQVGKIERALVEAGEDFEFSAEWPEQFRGFDRPAVVERTADVDLGPVLDMHEVPLLDVMAGERAAVVQEALATLPDIQRAVLERRFLEDKTYAEIGEELGLAGETVRRRACKGLAMLRHPARIGKLMEVR